MARVTAATMIPMTMTVPLARFFAFSLASLSGNKLNEPSLLTSASSSSVAGGERGEGGEGGVMMI